MEPFLLLGLLYGLAAVIRNGGGLDISKTQRLDEDVRRSKRLRARIEPKLKGQIPFVKPAAGPVRAVPVWMENGWAFSPRGYVGKFKTPYGSWDGRAYYDQGQGELRFIIYHPPKAALKGSHSLCFRKTEEPEAYWVHLNTPPADVFAGIQGIQKTLIESFKER